MFSARLGRIADRLAEGHREIDAAERLKAPEDPLEITGSCRLSDERCAQDVSHFVPIARCTARTRVMLCSSRLRIVMLAMGATKLQSISASSAMILLRSASVVTQGSASAMGRFIGNAPEPALF